ncbi:MAG: hypothetical protein NZ551_07620 [Microscillaceae bacterium]|nr:hypothetical protein [Microscillaceae bacterium]MDW8461064.1 hypothetical protein [Cytophagales bacterium]
MGVPFALFASLKGLRGGLCRASLTLRCYAPSPKGLALSIPNAFFAFYA